MTLLGPDTPESQVWEEELGPLLSSSALRELLNVPLERVSELLTSRRLIGLADSSGTLRFPAFQFKDGQVQEPLVRAYWTLADAVVDP